LKMGLAIVLTFIGLKMLLLAVGLKIPIYLSLIFVAVVLASSVIASLLRPKEAEIDIEVDLPEDFDPPFSHSHTEGIADEPRSTFGNNGQPSRHPTRKEKPENIARRQ
ncbi:MAG TPA: hypothetical protein VJV03_05495, partial [Pyrinomonadaceae bacterium]|nr:hypothetical protein [Pyrinomonadaceae bacterium]